MSISISPIDMTAPVISLLRRALLALGAPARHALELRLLPALDLRRVALRRDSPEVRIFVHDHVGADWKTCDWWCPRLLDRLLESGCFVVGQHWPVLHVGDLVGPAISWDVA